MRIARWHGRLNPIPLLTSSMIIINNLSPMIPVPTNITHICTTRMRTRITSLTPIPMRTIPIPTRTIRTGIRTMRTRTTRTTRTNTATRMPTITPMITLTPLTSTRRRRRKFAPCPVR